MILSIRQRNMLIAHLDGPAAIEAPSGSTWNRRPEQNAERARRYRTMTGLIARGLLRPDRQVHPTQTTITEDGRRRLAAALADWADALVRAGALDRDPLVNRLETILGASSAPCPEPPTPSPAAAGQMPEPSAPSTTP